MTYIVRRRNRYAVFVGMPAHMQNLLVEINLVRIGLFSHSPSLTSSPCGWTASSRVALFSCWTVGRACGRINRCRDPDFLSLEG